VAHIIIHIAFIRRVFADEVEKAAQRNDGEGEKETLEMGEMIKILLILYEWNACVLSLNRFISFCWEQLEVEACLSFLPAYMI